MKILGWYKRFLINVLDKCELTGFDSFFILYAVILTLGGCVRPSGSSRFNPEDETDEGSQELCAPTGRSLVNTGVYLAPEGCSDLTLYALQDQKPVSAWVLNVSWPMYGEHHALYLRNRRTNDDETEIVYIGDPDFVVYSGDYIFGGLKVEPGVNTIEFKVYNSEKTTDETYREKIQRQGTFLIDVSLSEATGK